MSVVYKVCISHGGSIEEITVKLCEYIYEIVPSTLAKSLDPRETQE